MSKRKLPRRDLPWLSTLLDKLPYTKLPTNGIVLRRLMFEIEHQHGATSLSSASLTVRNELVNVWEYAGYGDILQHPGSITKQINALHDSYKKLSKTPLSRRATDSFKKKESEFTKSLELLFDITVKSLQSSSLITPEDRDFLLYHWNKTISSTQDMATKLLVEKKLARHEKYQRFSSSHSSPKTPTAEESYHSQNSESSPNISVDSGEEFTPKRICTPRSSGTTVEISKDVL